MTFQTHEAHPFDHALTLNGEKDHRSAKISPAYRNMVGPFGGITAAQILKSVLSHPACVGSPVALTINYLGQISNDNLDIFPRLIRTNRSNQHWQVEARQGDQVQCTATIVCANRVNTMESEEISCPIVPPFDEVAPLPDASLPPWVSCYDIRFINGSLFQAHDNDKKPSESLAWMRDLPPRKLDLLSLTALCDAFFPRLFIRNRSIGIAGTVTLTIYFHITKQELEELSDYQVIGHARASKYFGSYFDQSAEIWDAKKRLIATTTQLVYFKD